MSARPTVSGESTARLAAARQAAGTRLHTQDPFGASDVLARTRSAMRSGGPAE